MHSKTPVYDAILAKLAPLNASWLDLQNESHRHGGYVAGKESHFKLTVVSPEFTNLPKIARHQKVYALLTPLLTAQGGSIHALALHLYSLDEWTGVSPDSPDCAGKNHS